jgi:hypothetical protein
VNTVDSRAGKIAAMTDCDRLQQGSPLEMAEFRYFG